MVISKAALGIPKSVSNLCICFSIGFRTASRDFVSVWAAFIIFSLAFSVFWRAVSMSASEFKTMLTLRSNSA